MARITDPAQALRALRAARDNIQSDISTDSRVRQGQARALARVDEVIVEYEKVLSIEKAVAAVLAPGHGAVVPISRDA